VIHPAPDAEAVSAALKRLRALVDSNDGGAADASRPQRTCWQALRDALGDFEFDKAAAQLDKIVSACGTSKA
jgi:hypothetical protein